MSAPSKEPPKDVPKDAAPKDAPKVESKDAKTTDKEPAMVSIVQKELSRALSGGISHAIVDVRVSNTEQQEADLSRNGYVQLLQEGIKKTNSAASNTFNNRSSLWVWRRSQGTCSGRLKPIIDILLDSSSQSSDLVLTGYTCDPVTIAGQTLWIKRATTEDEEKDAIVDLRVSTGKMKDTSDPIWSSPGVGWIRVDGNFTKGMFSSIDSFLWYRPSRTRSVESQMTNPIKGAVALTDEVRQTKLIAAVRLALRHYVPVNDIKRLATLTMESKEIVSSNSNIIRSERMMDFAFLFHQYAYRGKLSPSKWAKLLYDVGARMKSSDINQCFNFFDFNHNGFVSIEEYTKVLALTDYELDLAIEKIRLKLLLPCVPREVLRGNVETRLGSAVGKANVGVLGAQSINPHPFIGKNLIRENLTLFKIFGTINIKADNILSLDEVMDLASKVEVFVSEEETRKIMSMLDIDGDDRIEVTDFIAFMRRESASTIKKAYRIRESAALLRRWLVRGTSEKIETTATASKAQWKEFKYRYERSTNQKFPGFLSAPILQLSLASLGVRLSAIEARELTLIVAPEKNGRVHLSELHSFMGRSCRSFGELIAFVEKELFGDLIAAYRSHQAAVKATGKEDPDLVGLYKKKLDEIKKGVENVYNKPVVDPNHPDAKPTLDVTSYDEDDDESRVPMPIPTAPEPKFRKASHEVISVNQLKAGIEDVLNLKAKKISESMYLNEEEWAAMSILVDADVAEGDVYGVRLKRFLEGICQYVVNFDENKGNVGDKVSLELVARDLRFQIYREARANSKNKRIPDYKSVFDLFDDNHNGTISLAELKGMLRQLQLVQALPDYQMPNLLAMFDKSKKGIISFEDFKNFAEEVASVADEQDLYDDYAKLKSKKISNNDDKDSYLYDDDDDLGDDFDDDNINSVSDIPPIVITKNSDCDWLVWYLYRQACRIEPMDPESVITELETLCADTEMIQNKPNYISVKEFWNLLFELKLQSTLNKAQFIKGIQFVCEVGHGQDEDRVDYPSICKYIIRMGRAYLASLQERRKDIEKKFGPILQDLKKYFKDLCAEQAGDKNESIPRFEKIFRRLDRDSDGMLTPKEFRIGLKRLHYKDIKLWGSMMVKRLFDECDKNKDGLLSIKEFTNYILDKQLPMPSTSNKEAGTVKPSRDDPDASFRSDKLNLSDDEEDEFFTKKRALTDHELIRKVNDVLIDIVPQEMGVPPAKHLEVVRSSVRRFFQRADTEFKGAVSEERFRAFLRRSGLQDKLTASELRRLTDKLKRKGVGKDRYEVMIDYEKLCQQLFVATESIPKSRAEVVFTRFQDASFASASSGRSFLNLCSLIDLRLTGKISKEEFMHTSKMMDYPMTNYELEALLELLPPEVMTRDNMIDYRMVNNMLQTYTPRDSIRDIEPRASLGNTGRLSTTGALPAYASTPGGVTLLPAVPETILNRSISTPLGFSLTTPYKQYDDLSQSSRFMGFNSIPGTPNPYSNMQGNSAVSQDTYSKIIRSLVERVRVAVEERSRSWGGFFSLRKRLENLDIGNSGLVTIRTLQSLLEELGIILSLSEIQSLQNLYGRADDDRIFYDSFCRSLDSFVPLERGNGNQPISSGQPAYINNRVLQRFNDLKAEGRDPRDMFEAFDLDRTGMILVNKFKEINAKLQLLPTEHQLTKVLEDFSTIGNRSYINYEDFCTTIERAAINVRDSSTMVRSSRKVGIAEGDGYDGIKNGYDNYTEERVSVAREREREREKERERDEDVYESMSRMRMSNAKTNNNTRSYPIDLDVGSADGGYGNDYALSPPKVSDSVNSLSLSRRNFPSSPQRLRYGSTSRDFVEPNRNSIQVARTSPSKVGSKMWGNETPLAQKGKALRVDEDKWCCAVCLYVENPISADRCVVCDSPNYAVRKDHQVKEQCLNCTFLNGQFAEECEMCGEPLISSGQYSKKKTNGYNSGPSSANNTPRKPRRDVFY